MTPLRKTPILIESIRFGGSSQKLFPWYGINIPKGKVDKKLLSAKVFSYKVWNVKMSP